MPPISRKAKQPLPVEPVALESVTTPAGEVPDALLPEVKLYCKGSPLGPLSGPMMRSILGWENEQEYKERRKQEDPDTPSESFKFVTETMVKEGKVKDQKPNHILLTDHKNRKVVCWKNDNNRPFDESHSKKLCQEILTRRWAGPTTMPGKTVNGEAIIGSWMIKVDRYPDPVSIVINGQHTGCGLVLAYELWADEDEDISGKWRALWPPDLYPDGPVIDKVAVVGVCPDSDVVRTLDNTKPRSLADTIYTSDVFINLPDSEKKLASRMLSSAIDFLWSRLRVGGAQDGFLKKLYQTHATSHDWLARHPKLLKCIEHLFVENKGRTITKLKLSAGECAAVMYIQASAESSADDYYAQEEPTESTLNWELWKASAAFWSKVANAEVEKEGRNKGQPKDMESFIIRKVLTQVVEPETEDDEGNSVTVEQKASSKRTAKMVVLSKAWALFKEGQPITEDAIKPKYSPTDASPIRDDNGNVIGSEVSNVTLDDTSHFGGIDLGDPTPKGKSAGVKALTEEQKQEGAERVALAGIKLANDAAARASMAMNANEKYLHGKEKHGKDRILLFLPKGSKRLTAYDKDADVLGEECGCAVGGASGVRMTHQAIGDCDDITRQLLSAGYQVAVIQEISETEDKVTYHNPIRRKLPKIPAVPLTAPKPNPSDASSSRAALNEDPAAVAKKTRG